MELNKGTTIEYLCHYKNKYWHCKIENIERSEQITGFTVSGRGSSYHVYLIEFQKRRWLDIPVMGISSKLSDPDDIFWNSEKLTEKLNSIIDGITIANGIKMLSRM